MIPILFAESATQFNTNGLGRLDAVSCTVTEERNGAYELKMTILESTKHADEIEMSSIIYAKPNQSSDNQAFRVYKITKPINGKFEVYAQHISYQLSYIPAMPFNITASSSACAQTLAALKTNAVENCPFTFSTDVTTVASYSQTIPASIRSRLGGVEGSVLDQFGGEYEWNNYSVVLHENRGVTTPTVTLRYGKNITDLTQEENISSTITGIVPFWQSTDGATTVTLTEKSVDSSYASSYPFKRTIPYDFSQDFDEQPTEAQLRTKAQAYVNASGIGVPKVSIKLSFVNLSDTEDYKDIAALQSVSLCDHVNVYFEELGISTTAEVVKVKYDVLKERYLSIEIGSIKSTLASTISGTNDALTTYANNTKRMFENYSGTVETLVDNATAWLTGSDGYVMAVKNTDGTWKELLFLDTADASTATNVLRVNENGIGFSSTGVSGPYTQAWTLDGRLVIGGTNVPSLTVYDNNNNVIFQTTASGTIWNSTNSSMTATGILTAIGAVLTNCTLSNKNSTTNYGISIDENSINFSLSDTNHASVEYTYDTYEYKIGSQWYTASYYMLKMLCDNIVMLQSNSGSGANIQVGSNNAGSITLDATAGIWLRDTHQNYGGELTVLDDMITDFELTISPYDYINVVDDIWYEGDCVSWTTTSVASDYTVGIQNVQRGNYLCV